MIYEKTLKKICRLPKVTEDLIHSMFLKHEKCKVQVVSKNLGKPGFEIITNEGTCFVTERTIDYYNKKWGRATNQGVSQLEKDKNQGVSQLDLHYFVLTLNHGNKKLLLLNYLYTIEVSTLFSFNGTKIEESPTNNYYKASSLIKKHQWI